MDTQRAQTPEKRQVLRIFLASPGDLVAERRRAREVVDDVNKSTAESLGYFVELLGWEDTLPGADRAQDLINDDLMKCDLFVGMLWKRWGQSTGKSSSGFKEEFDLATELHKKHKRPEIWLFFKRVPVNDTEGAESQLCCVTEFKKSIVSAKSPFFKEFKSPGEWERKFRVWLTKYLHSRAVSSSGAARAARRTVAVKRDLAMKKRLLRALMKDAKKINWEEVRKDPRAQFAVPRVIIRSVDDNSYPGPGSSEAGISGWFKVDLWNFYYRGIELALAVEHGVTDEKGRWSVIEYGQSFDERRYRKIKMFRLGRIPFRNIVAMDTKGDEYYDEPHLFCRFQDGADGNEPYEGFRYVQNVHDFFWTMEPDLQFDIREQVERER